MKTSRFLTYKKISRLAYTLGTLFLLCGLLLSLVSQPVSAQAPRPTRQPAQAQPTAQPHPENPPDAPDAPHSPDAPGHNPAQKPAQPKKPAHPLSPDQPGKSAASSRVEVQVAPVIESAEPQRVVKTERPSVLVMVGDIEFLQPDSPLCQIEPGWVTAQVLVTLPSDADEARLVTYYKVVHPDDQRTGEIHWPDQTVHNGDVVEVKAWWPGIRPTDDLVEIHWGATLHNGGKADSDGLDFWYNRADTNMPCTPATETPTATVTPTPVPDLTLDHKCDVANQTIDWTVTNPGTEAVDFEWSLDDGAQTGSSSIAAGATETFHSSSNGTHSMDITWDDGAGGTGNASHTAENCQPLSAPSIGRLCAADGIHWSVSNPNNVAMTIGWSLAGGSDGSLELAAGETAQVAVTPGGAHTLDVTYPGGSLSQSSEDGECIASLQISTLCDTGAITWSVINTGSAPANLTWTLDGSAQAGGGQVPAGESLTLTSASDESAHELLVTWAGGTLASTTIVGFCSVPTPDPLTLGKACSSQGIVWTVNNPRDVDVPIEWALGGESGSETVPANGSLDVTTTPGGAHTLEVTWDGGSDTLSSVEGECSPVLAINPSCNLETDQVDWIVTNTGSAPVEIEWNLDSGAQTGTLTIDEGASQTVANTSDESAHELLVNWADGSLSGSTAAGVCNGMQTLPLTIQAGCSDDNQRIQWQVVNNNDFSLPFSWTLDKHGTAGSSVAPANGTVDVTRSALGNHRLEVEWEEGSASHAAHINHCGPVQTKTPTSTPPPSEEDDPVLTFNQNCAVTDSTATFSVYNPNAAAMTIQWSLDGGAQSGTLTVPPGTRVTILTVPANTAHTMRVEWPRSSGGTGVVEVSSPACQQTVANLNLTLDYACVETESLRWIVTNPSGAAVSFTWSLDNGAQTGSDTVPANGSREFLVTSASVSHSVTIRWNNTNGAVLTANRVSPAQACGQPAVGGFEPTATPGAIPITGELGIPVTGATPSAMQPPSAAGQGVELQPVNGGDMTALPLGSLGFWQALLQNLGLLLFGVALIFQGLSRRSVK